MADDTSCRFDISPHQFLALFCFTYNQWYPGLCQLCHPPTEFISSMISDLCRCPYKAVTDPTTAPSPFMASSFPYAPTSSWTTYSRTWTSQTSRFFIFIDTGSVMVVSPTKLLSSGRNILQYFSAYHQDPPSGGTLRPVQVYRVALKRYR